MITRMAREPLLGTADELKPELLSAFAPALVNTLKSILGTGLLAIPHEFAGVGITAGLVLTAVVGTWSCYTMHLIAHCTLLANATGSTTVTTFGELVALALGPRTGAVLGTSNLVLHQLLCCAAYMVFVGDTIEQVFGLPATTVILVATPPFAALCTLRDMRLLGPTSVSGTAVLLMVLWDCYHGTEHGPRLRSHAVASPSALASFVAVSLFTFAGHTEVVSVIRSMGAEAPRYRTIPTLVLLVCVPLIMGFGAAAATCLGRRTPNNVLLGLHSEVGTWAKLFMSLSIFFSLPVKMFPAVQALERIFVPPDAPCARATMCVSLALCSSALAVLLPDFGFLVAIVGALCMGLIAFVLPPAVYLALEAKQAGRATVAAHGALLAMGLLVTVGATGKVLADKLQAS